MSNLTGFRGQGICCWFFCMATLCPFINSGALAHVKPMQQSPMGIKENLVLNASERLW